MADKKISQLTALSAANLAPSTDVLAIVDTSATETKKIVAQDLINGVLNVASAVGIGTASPASQLDVTKTGDAVFSLTSSGVQRYQLIARSSGNFEIYDQSAAASRVTMTQSGNLGLGVTPSAWVAGAEALQVNGVSISESSLGAEFSYNTYRTAASTWNAIATGGAARYGQAGDHRWYVGSGTAGNTITFTQAMTLDADRRLQLNTTTFVGNEQFVIAFSSSGSVTQALNTRDTNASANNNSHIVLRRSDDTYLGALGRADTDTAMFVDGNSYLSFRTGGTNRARITSGGDFLVGTTATGLQTVRSMGFQVNAGCTQFISHSTADGSGDSYVEFGYNGTKIGSITQNGTTAVAYNTTSDYRLKTFISSVTGAGARLDALKPVEYEWKADGKRARGFFAHEFQQVYADSVTGEKDAVDAVGKPVYQAMQASTTEVIADLVAEIQSLRSRVAALEAK